MRKILTSLLLLAWVGCAVAQKQLYIPMEWRNTGLYSEVDTENKYQYSKSRSQESENFIVYWANGYGNTHPSEAPATYRVDIDDLLEKAEWFYSLNVGKLAFCDETNSNVSKYKMIICLLHDSGWVATGSGYDNVIGALWITPSTCKPVGHTIAHEIGHSFQYQCFCDLKGNAGFRTAIGSGSTFWEQTAQWQAAQAYPEQAWTESWLVYGTPFFPRTSNYAMTHEHMRYQSYWWHYYLVDRYGIDFIGKLWRHDAGKGLDPNEVLMDLLGIDSDELYKMYFEYAMKMATVDFEATRDAALPYVLNYPYAYNYVALGGAKYQVAFSSVPQSTGFNIIPLAVPEAGATITTEFTSPKSPVKIADGDPLEYHNGDRYVRVSGDKPYYNINSKYNNQRGYRLGYALLMKDGTRQYISEDSIYCSGGGAGDKSATISAAIPENVDRLWLVVSPAPRTYIQHLWDENVMNDDQWPYTVEFEGTNIKGAPIIDDQLPITDATITYNITMPRDGSSYTGVAVNLEGEAAAALGTAFQMQASDLSAHLVEWSSSEPADGQVKFYAVNPTTGNLDNQSSTANGHGHWFNQNGVRSDWSSGYLYSEFTPTLLMFGVGQYPGRLTVGNEYQIAQAFKYHRGNETATVKFIFHIQCVSPSTPASYELVSIEQDDIITGIHATAPDQPSSAVPVAYYTLSGTQVSAPQKGFHIVRYADGQTKKIFCP